MRYCSIDRSVDFIDMHTRQKMCHLHHIRMLQYQNIIFVRITLLSICVDTTVPLYVHIDTYGIVIYILLAHSVKDVTKRCICYYDKRIAFKMCCYYIS